MSLPRKRESSSPLACPTLDAGHGCLPPIKYGTSLRRHDTTVINVPFNILDSIKLCKICVSFVYLSQVATKQRMQDTVPAEYLTDEVYPLNPVLLPNDPMKGALCLELTVWQ